MNPGAEKVAPARHGKVTQLPSARVYAVKDAYGSYVVTLLVRSAHCSCPARGDCSHKRAAQREARADARKNYLMKKAGQASEEQTLP